jgi:hypothetical protein
LAECSVDSIAGRFEVTQKSLADLIASRDCLCLGRYCCRNRTRTDNLEQCGFDGVIHPQSRKVMQRGSPLSSRPR